MKKTDEMVTIGHSIPRVPLKDFNKRPFNLVDAWKLVGPTIKYNSNRPQWELYAIAYVQGLMHGAQSCLSAPLSGGKE